MQMYRDENGWTRVYEDLDAYWVHGGNSRQPHAELTSGLHSNGFFNSKIVIERTDLLSEAASDILELVEARGIDRSVIERVVGPATGATKLAEIMGSQLGCAWTSPEKRGEGNEKFMHLTPDEAAIMFGDMIFLCEDVITTGGSVERTAAAIVAAQGELLPYVGVLVNRSGLHEVNGRQIVALITRDMPMWTPEECPLCKAGSKPIRPKENDGANWKLLTANYD